MDCSEEKKQLIEEAGLFFEKKYKFSPLVARIHALMILSSNQGHTFEEIMEITGASKGSVSTSLNLLIQLQSVEYITNSGDRKRYFRSTKKHLKNTLRESLDRIHEEMRLTERFNAYNCKHNKQKFIKNESIGLMFLDYLKSQEQNIKETIAKMDNFLSENAS
ncbi:ArsR family transcriptional regulator [Porifericola rhodea]|uniref:GbsR/MarR family transcriptional regulator n=1 Tax=Porifericola rhodea TaxID=930972 RepID=UPI0026670480|nr:ArsR family transcriptional regulator [Porifericola rhodea]WKN29592.1 ArsR family transcriptional regulator [Porifericola rhodea]